MNNFFFCPDSVRLPGAPEVCETLLRGPGVTVERIVSWGQSTPEGEWYDQACDEWVLLLEGEAELGYEDGSTVRLRKGESLFLPRHVRHRVLYTGKPCIWLAVHGQRFSLP